MDELMKRRSEKCEVKERERERKERRSEEEKKRRGEREKKNPEAGEKERHSNNYHYLLGMNGFNSTTKTRKYQINNNNNKICEINRQNWTDSFHLSVLSISTDLPHIKSSPGRSSDPYIITCIYMAACYTGASIHTSGRVNRVNSAFTVYRVYSIYRARSVLYSGVECMYTYP